MNLLHDPWFQFSGNLFWTLVNILFLIRVRQIHKRQSW